MRNIDAGNGNSVAAQAPQTSRGSVRQNAVQTRTFRSRNNFCSLLTGDAVARLRNLPDNSINVAVTSPPYFWVRDYGVSGQIGASPFSS